MGAVVAVAGRPVDLTRLMQAALREVAAYLLRREPLTPKQATVYRFVRAWVADQGSAPTSVLVARTLGYSQTEAHRLLTVLIDKGWLVRRYGRPFGLGLGDEPGMAPVVVAQLDPDAVLEAALARVCRSGGRRDVPREAAFSVECDASSVGEASDVTNTRRGDVATPPIPSCPSLKAPRAPILRRCHE